MQGALDYSGFGSVDMVIEAAIEDVGLKQEIFAELERSCRKDAILATNTSTINIELVGAKTSCAGEGHAHWAPCHICQFFTAQAAPARHFIPKCYRARQTMMTGTCCSPFQQL